MGMWNSLKSSSEGRNPGILPEVLGGYSLTRRLLWRELTLRVLSDQSQNFMISLYIYWVLLYYYHTV